MGVNLLHPFTVVGIKLPNLKSFSIRDWKYQAPIKKYAHYIKNLFYPRIPWRHQTTSWWSFTTVLIKLGYCKWGDKIWIMIETANTGCLADVIYYTNSFFAINYGAGITIFKGDNLTKETHVIKMSGHLNQWSYRTDLSGRMKWRNFIEIVRIIIKLTISMFSS